MATRRKAKGRFKYTIPQAAAMARGEMGPKADARAVGRRAAAIRTGAPPRGKKAYANRKEGIGRQRSIAQRAAKARSTYFKNKAAGTLYKSAR